MDRTHEDIHDELLVLQCQNGDADALKALVARYHPRLGRLAWRLTAERDAVRDIVQESWLAIVRGINRLDDPARFRAWAGRIVRNKCADWTRRKIVHRSATQDLHNAAVISASGNPSAESESESELTRLRDALVTRKNEAAERPPT